MSTSTTSARSITLPPAQALVAGVYALCVLLPIVFFVGDILLTDKDPHRSEGPIASIIGVASFGTAALAIGVGLALWLVRTPERAKVGALVLGVLSVVTLIFFWSGAPGIFGACAAWSAGLTRGGQRLPGAARVAGIAGAFIVLLNVVLSIGGNIAGAVGG